MKILLVGTGGGVNLPTSCSNQMFEEGKKIDCFGTPQELREKIAYYLNH